MTKTQARTIARKQRAECRRRLACAIELAVESLRSHLSDAVKAEEANEEWHAACCRDYTTMLDANAMALHELTKIDFPKEYTPRCKKIS
jgi:hypothetical protein